MARHAVNLNAQGGNLWEVFNQIPDLVNGEVTNFTFIFVGAGLHSAYHWVSDAASPGEVALDTVDRLTDYIVNTATIMSLLIQAAAAPVQMPDVKARSYALIITTGRAAMKRAWGMVDADVIATQTNTLRNAAGAQVTFQNGNVLSGDAACGITDAEFTAERALVLADYDAHKDTFYYQFLQTGVGMPPNNGVTMVSTMIHHYADPHKQICDAIVDQHVNLEQNVPNGLTKDEIRDAACHKTSHPVKSPVLVGLSRSAEVKERLKAIGHGSATVRLPARFAPEKAADAFKALVHKAKQAGKASNIAVDTASVDALCAAVSAEMTANPNQTGLSASDGLVEAFKVTNGLDIAWLAGFMAASFEASNASPRARSILDSYAVKGLIEEEQPSYAEGFGHYGDAAKWRRARAREGHLAGYGKMGADDPPAFANPEATTAGGSGN